MFAIQVSPTNFQTKLTVTTQRDVAETKSESSQADIGERDVHARHRNLSWSTFRMGLNDTHM